MNPVTTQEKVEALRRAWRRGGKILGFSLEVRIVLRRVKLALWRRTSGQEALSPSSTTSTSPSTCSTSNHFSLLESSKDSIS